jgi:hypothetical protein
MPTAFDATARDVRVVHEPVRQRSRFRSEDRSVCWNDDTASAIASAVTASRSVASSALDSNGHPTSSCSAHHAA